MKNLKYAAIAVFACLFTAALFSFTANTQQAGFEYKQVTVVESIIPMGIGRSRIIEENSPINAADYTTQRVNGKKSNQGDVKRGDIKINKFSETKLLNFFSGVGINFQNIASNDAVICSKINNLAAQGWELSFVASGVESVGDKSDNNGIYITRYVFKKAK